MNFYYNQVAEFAKKIKRSDRGELEITDINKLNLKMNDLHAQVLGKEFTRIDTGTHSSLVMVTNTIKDLEQ